MVGVKVKQGGSTQFHLRSSTLWTESPVKVSLPRRGWQTGEELHGDEPQHLSGLGRKEGTRTDEDSRLRAVGPQAGASLTWW